MIYKCLSYRAYHRSIGREHIQPKCAGISTGAKWSYREQSREAGGRLCHCTAWRQWRKVNCSNIWDGEDSVSNWKASIKHPLF